MYNPWIVFCVFDDDGYMCSIHENVDSAESERDRLNRVPFVGPLTEVQYQGCGPFYASRWIVRNDKETAKHCEFFEQCGNLADGKRLQTPDVDLCEECKINIRNELEEMHAKCQ